MKHPALLFFSSAHPMFANFTFDFVKVERETLSVILNAEPVFIHHKDGNYLHSGLCTLVLDSIMGGSVMGCMERLQPIATINLNTQHSHRPVVGNRLLCTANVECIEHKVAVVNGRMSCEDTRKVLSTANGSFMIGTRSTPLASRQESTNG